MIHLDDISLMIETVVFTDNQQAAASVAAKILSRPIAQNPTQTKFTTMDITAIKLTRTKVFIAYSTKELGDATLEHADKPLPSFYKAMEALSPLVIETLGLPKSYVGKKPAEGDKEPGLPLTPTGITIHLKGESRMVCITATKVLADTPSPFNITVPNRYMDAPTKEGSSSVPYSDKHVNLLEDVIEEAKKYLRGERAQGQLPLETAEQAAAEPQDGNQENLPGT